MQFPHGETVFRDRRPQIPDPYNPARTVPGEFEDGTTVTLSGCFVASSSSSNSGDATRNQILTSKSLYCAPGADVQAGDRIRTASGTWYVNVLSSADVNPFTGWQPAREVPLDGALN